MGNLFFSEIAQTLKMVKLGVASIELCMLKEEVFVFNLHALQRIIFFNADALDIGYKMEMLIFFCPCFLWMVLLLCKIILRDEKNP